jgi:CRP/FNR family transcriptional regulator
MAELNRPLDAGPDGSRESVLDVVPSEARPNRGTTKWSHGQAHVAPLTAVPLFQHVSAERLSRMSAESTLEQYEKGRTLFREGDPAEEVWVVTDGWIHLVRSSPGFDSGKTVLFTITPSELLCGISAIDSGVHTVGAVAGTDCTVVRIPQGLFVEALSHEPDFAYATLRLCARHIQHICEQYGTMAEPVSGRIVRAILRLHQQFGTTLPITHRELAQMAWTTTESAIRTVRRLKQAGYMTGTRGQLTLTRVKGLGRLLRQQRHPAWMVPETTAARQQPQGTHA